MSPSFIRSDIEEGLACCTEPVDPQAELEGEKGLGGEPYCCSRLCKVARVFCKALTAMGLLLTASS